jgi:hypothetical protein
MNALLLTVAGVALLATLLWWGMRPRVHRNVPLAGLRRFVESLMVQMAPGGFFVAQRVSGDGFLQLALRSVRGERYTLEFGLPDVAWSAGGFDSLHTALAREAFAPAVEGGAGQVARFMRVVLDGSASDVAERAVALFRLAARSLQWPDETAFNVHFGGSLDVTRIRAHLARAKKRGA